MNSYARPEIEAVVARARSAFESGVTRSLANRRRNLDALRRMLEENRREFEEALHADLGKSPREAGLTEIDAVLGEIAHIRRHLKRWTAPRRIGAPATHWPSFARVVPEPLGVVLVMSPWNYPVNLTLNPLVGVLAAGNGAVVKPSPDSPHSSEVMARLTPEYFPDGAVQFITGPISVAEQLLEQQFDHIIFTGSGPVGRIVMEAASKHLTPVTLELGGKSPVWFDDDERIDDVARRLAWAKYTNAGQTCVSPDYVLTTPERIPALIEALHRAVVNLWGEDPAQSEYGRIINERNFDRLVGYLEGVDIAFGGKHDRSERYIEPTVVTIPPGGQSVVGPESPHAVLREEIFGPVLPIVPVASKEQAVQVITGWCKPLALYVFSGSKDTRRFFEQRTSSGTMVYNAALIQAAATGVPFGGVGASGMGRYHGRASIESFSNMKTVLSKPLRPDTLRLVAPGVDPRLQAVLSKIQRRG
ncbi:aldehyde dehydrogenase family protein [Kitasatospora purpeofusca]|uniref:aldehyde dehydrogenase family protein n=1 Tax=Kitasatospora purpeofusca TaxID=67352 RepID=UPI00340FE17E